MMNDSESRAAAGRTLDDMELFQTSPFLSDLVGRGVWRESSERTAEPWMSRGDMVPSFQNFRQEFQQMAEDPEAALLSLRRLRIRTLLAVARADLANRLKPYQVRARLRALAEIMVQGAWGVAENDLRNRFVHPLILERRNIIPPVAVFSLSRLGAGEPFYTTGPAPIFVHSRAAEFAPALTPRDFDAARRTAKEWMPARDYFHRLVSRIMYLLAAPNAAGKGFAHMAEDHFPDGPPLLPGALVVLYSAFEDHFMARPPKERLTLLRLRFLTGMKRLGRAVEETARMVLLRTADELGGRLRGVLNEWYRERSRGEGLPLSRGGLLDIERKIRLLQFRHAPQYPAIMTPSPLKAMDLMTQSGLISGDDRLMLSRSYNWQWFVANRLCLLGRREALAGDELKGEALDHEIGQPGASSRTLALMKSAHAILNELVREPKGEGLDED